jgi:hypothetical protein
LYLLIQLFSVSISSEEEDPSPLKMVFVLFRTFRWHDDDLAFLKVNFDVWVPTRSDFFAPYPKNSENYLFHSFLSISTVILKGYVLNCKNEISSFIFLIVKFLNSIFGRFFN